MTKAEYETLIAQLSDAKRTNVFEVASLALSFVGIVLGMIVLF